MREKKKFSPSLLINKITPKFTLLGENVLLILLEEIGKRVDEGRKLEGERRRRAGSEEEEEIHKKNVSRKTQRKEERK